MSKRPSHPSREAPNPAITRRLLRWFARHKRDLPWRAEPRDPYHVWLAEIMLQQTQVATVIPYYQRWLARFPTLKDLAAAPLDDVLKQWEGMGYYSRARNLHRAAQMVLQDFGGHIPDTVEGLLTLPGIGRYTAGAIASLAFKRDAPILDGNVARVFSRVFAIERDVKSPLTIKELWALSDALLPAGHAGEFNEALMDLGATICTPRSPDCPTCPLNTLCSAYAKGKPEDYPVKAIRRERPHKDIGSAVIYDADWRLLLAQRPAKGLLGGLWEFPGGEVNLAGEIDLPTQLSEVLRAKTGLRLRIDVGDFIGLVKHGFTHFQMTRHVALLRVSSHQPAVRIGSDYTDARWVMPKELKALALTRSDQRIAALVLKDGAHTPHLL
jgi:A/G-specific adenine glycosylase